MPAQPAQKRVTTLYPGDTVDLGTLLDLIREASRDVASMNHEMTLRCVMLGNALACLEQFYQGKESATCTLEALFAYKHSGVAKLEKRQA